MNQFDSEAIRQTAEQFRQLIEAQSGSRLDFELSSLAVFDAVLSEWIDLASVYGGPDNQIQEFLIVPIASYVGEVLSTSLGAEWEVPSSGDARFPVLRLPTGQRIDLVEAASTIVHGFARPAFHQLAVDLTQSSAGDRDRP